jgi:mono/diheme cytochrome c family protein
MLRSLLVAAALFGAASAVADDTMGLDDWAKISHVMHNPRCHNCHTSTEYPRQGDDQHRHEQMVMRGPIGKGTPALQCESCHQVNNSRGGSVPGAKDWQLPPDTMGWAQ